MDRLISKLNKNEEINSDDLHEAINGLVEDDLLAANKVLPVFIAKQLRAMGESAKPLSNFTSEYAKAIEQCVDDGKPCLFREMAAHFFDEWKKIQEIHQPKASDLGYFSSILAVISSYEALPSIAEIVAELVKIFIVNVAIVDAKNTYQYPEESKAKTAKLESLGVKKREISSGIILPRNVELKKAIETITEDMRTKINNVAIFAGKEMEEEVLKKQAQCLIDLTKKYET